MISAIADSLSFSWFVCLCGSYVEQVDQVVEELSVEENLMFYAHLKLRGTTLQEKRARVGVLLSQLRLLECRHVRAGGSSNAISGGQKRRLSVAIEILALPRVVFLDEPTSGLDASSALELTQLLKSIADSGRTICLTIHQPRPEIFSIIDHLYILARGGSHAFCGPPNRAKDFFRAVALHLGFDEAHYEAAGTADLILDVLSKPIPMDELKQVRQRQRHHGALARAYPAGLGSEGEEEEKEAGEEGFPVSVAPAEVRLDFCGGPWVQDAGDKMVTWEDSEARRASFKHALKHSPAGGEKGGRKTARQSMRVCRKFPSLKNSLSGSGRQFRPIPAAGGGAGGLASRSSRRGIAGHVRRDLWWVVRLSVRDQRGRGRGQGARRVQYFVVNLAACFILSSVYWQYHVTSYADMFPLMSAMYLAVISCVMVVQFTHFNLFINEANNLEVASKRDAYSRLAYFVHCLLRDSFFFCAGAAVLWVPCAFAIGFAGAGGGGGAGAGAATPGGFFTALLLVALFVNFFGSFIRLVTLIWHRNLHVANVVVGFLLAWCVLFSGLFV